MTLEEEDDVDQSQVPAIHVLECRLSADYRQCPRRLPSGSCSLFGWTASSCYPVRSSRSFISRDCCADNCIAEHLLVPESLLTLHELYRAVHNFFLI